MDKVKILADELYNQKVIDGWKNVSMEDCLKRATDYYRIDEIVKNNDLLHSVSGCFLQNYYYHPENEGTAKTFRNVVTEKWYYESDLCDVIGITNVEYLKSNYR